MIFLQSLNLPKCIGIGLSVVERLLSLLFYFESGINQYGGQKTLTDIFGASLLLLLISCFKGIVLSYHLRMLFLCFYKKLTSSWSNNFISILFCTIYEKEYIFKCEIKGAAACCSFHLLVTLLKANKIVWCDLNFPIIWG